MTQLRPDLKVTDGLVQDPASGNYRVLPGYSQQTMRYAINETWLDEDDQYWIAKDAVERELSAEQAQDAQEDSAA